jgi:hypothetical protein
VNTIVSIKAAAIDTHDNQNLITFSSVSLEERYGVIRVTETS